MATHPIIDDSEGEHERGRTRTKTPAHPYRELGQILEVTSSHGESLHRDDISEHDFLYVPSSPTREKQPPRGAGARPPDEHHRTSNNNMADPATSVPRHPGHHSKHRKLVLCFDGTGNKFHGDDSDSNILKIFRMLDRTASDQCEQCRLVCNPSLKR